MARTGGEGAGGVSAIVVEKGTPGLSFGAPGAQDGLDAASPPPWSISTTCRVPVANRIGDEGQGFRFAMMGLDGGRLNIAACSLGGAGLAFETARAYLASASQFGRPLTDVPGAAVQAGRHGDRAGGRAADGAPRRRRARRRRSGRHQALRHGQALRHRRRLRRRQPGAAAARRLRLPEGLSAGAHRPRPARPPDPRRHQRDHAGDHRAGAADNERAESSSSAAKARSAG